MKLPAQPASGQPNPPLPRRPEGSSVAAPVNAPALKVTTLAGLIAFAGVAGVAANRHAGGNTEWISLGWTAITAIGILGFAGVLAQGAFKTFKSNGFANLVFAFFMVIGSAAAVLVKGPAHNFAMMQLSTAWPKGAELLAKTDPAGTPAPKTATAQATPSSNSANSNPAVKGQPSIKVYRKPDQSASVHPKGE